MPLLVVQGCWQGLEVGYSQGRDSDTACAKVLGVGVRMGNKASQLLGIGRDQEEQMWEHIHHRKQNPA